MACCKGNAWAAHSRGERLRWGPCTAQSGEAVLRTLHSTALPQPRTFTAVSYSPEAANTDLPGADPPALPHLHVLSGCSCSARANPRVLPYRLLRHIIPRTPCIPLSSFPPRVHCWPQQGQMGTAANSSQPSLAVTLQGLALKWWRELSLA